MGYKTTTLKHNQIKTCSRNLELDLKCVTFILQLFNFSAFQDYISLLWEINSKLQEKKKSELWDILTIINKSIKILQWHILW